MEKIRDQKLEYKDSLSMVFFLPKAQNSIEVTIHIPIPKLKRLMAIKIHTFFCRNIRSGLRLILNMKQNYNSEQNIHHIEKA